MRQANPPPTPEAEDLTPSAKRRRQVPRDAADAAESSKSEEIGGPTGPEPTRYGDWERKGIVSDF
jgi:hypothetical protein